MITEHDLQEAIAECEGQRNPTSSTCLKLAAFYTIRDKMYPAKQEKKIMSAEPQYYSMSSGPIETDSEFKQAASKVDYSKFIDIMDELMSVVSAIVPKLYDSVMRKLTS